MSIILVLLVYGATDSKFGAAESLFNVVNNAALNHQLEVTAGVIEEDCRELMKNFFKNLSGGSRDVLSRRDRAASCR